MNLFRPFLAIFVFFLMFRISAQVAANDSGRTPGSLSVSPTGGAIYSVAVDVPPGVNDVAPNISIAYSSQSGNGLAGWGWGLTGVSSITRLASTLYHDGEIDPVDFDSKDRFALDGQRLMLKSGTYGKDGAVYQTEQYSNLKIISYGVSDFGSNYGPQSFLVLYPDGSKAWYGDTAFSKSRMEWALQKWEDPNGNYIKYSYETSSRLLRLVRIEYGAGKNQAAPLWIDFEYRNRKRQETSFVAGLEFTLEKILDRIEVKHNGKLLRKYQLGHAENSLGYETLEFIQEHNGDNKALEPIRFTYSTSSDGISKVLDTGEGSRYGSYADLKKSSGDFNGDGRLDYVAYGYDPDKNRSYVVPFVNFHDGDDLSGQEFLLSKFDELVTGPVLVNDGLSDKQGITTITESYSSSRSDSDVVFKTHVLNGTSLDPQYSKTWKAPTYRSDPNGCGNPYYNKISKKYVSGDFNGDGLMDVISLSLIYNQRVCVERNNCDDGDGGGGGDGGPGTEYQVNDQPIEFSSADDCCDCSNTTKRNSQSHFIDLNSQKTTGFSNYSGEIGLEIRAADRTFAADFDGDGKSDLIIIKTGQVHVYTLDKNNSMRFLAKVIDDDIKTDLPILPGDYNGDGKFDFAVAMEDKSSEWKFFMSGGTDFRTVSKNIGVQFDEFRAEGQITYEYLYNPQDLNGDGKTDILKHHIRIKGGGDNEAYQLLELYANSTTENVSLKFTRSTFKTYTDTTVRPFGFPIFTENSFNNGTSEYLYLSGRYIQLYEFEKDNRAETSLLQVTNSGVVTKIAYDNLVTVPDNRSNGDVYGPMDGQTFPYSNINLAPNFKVVEGIEQTGSGITRNQDYYYSGAVGHAQGLGFMGFTTVLRSNWYGDGVTKLWSGTEYDHQKRGAVKSEWVSNYYLARGDESISTVEYTHEHQTFSNKVYLNTMTRAVSRDILKGISHDKTFTYDGHNNPTRVSTVSGAGTKTETYSYIQNPSSVSDYYVGRPKEKLIVSVLDGNSFSSEEAYTYQGHLVTDIKTRGAGTPWLTESFGYDSFGNVIRKELNAQDMPSRYEYFTYDNDGRFLVSQKDPEGLVTDYSNETTYGGILQATDPYGLKTKYEYDGWGRLVMETDYLGKKTSYTYQNTSDGGLKVEVDYDQGPDSIKFFNAFGWETQTRTLSLNGRYIYEEKRYDAAGRIVSSSEPSYGAAQQWNTMAFDEYGRVVEQRTFTGKATTFSHNGLSVTANDGTRTATTTRNASGNIVKLVDDGGTVTYRYHGNGMLKEADYGGQKMQVDIDAWGRKTRLVDHSAGTNTYSYNIFGELLKETTPKGETEYAYDGTGKILKTTIRGDETDLELNYSYNSDRLLYRISGEDKKFGKSYTYDYTYDGYRRNIGIVENNDLARFEKQYTYDGHGRPYRETYLTTNGADGTQATVTIKNLYDTDSGITEQLVDEASSDILWRIDTHDQWGHPTKITLGNGHVETNTYSDLGTLTGSKVQKSGSNTVRAMDMEYSFNARRGILEERTNNALDRNEAFVHDAMDRLTDISGPNAMEQRYNPNGTIASNSQIGAYSYRNDRKYQLAGLDLNDAGQGHYQGRAVREIVYNAFKKPVSVHNEGAGRVDFEYGILGNRSHAWYGGDMEEKEERRYRKHYSAIMPVEIEEDNTSDNVKIITYIGGDGYTAPMAHIKTKNNDVTGFHYLHRDYLGSILAITDSSGSVREQSQFGAWGKVDRFLRDGIDTEFGHDSLLGRGYTGHEHFFEVGLIHMNGRMYDASLGRFLSPDNYVQDPYNTQNFDRYGYVLNNPLTYNDPSGEIIPLVIWAGVAIGAYMGGSQANGNWNPLKWKWGSSRTWAGIIGGAIVGGVSAGIGAAVASAATGLLATTGLAGTFAGSVIVGAASGAAAGFISGGAMEVMPGGSGNFWQGAKRGFISGAVLGGVMGGLSQAWRSAKLKYFSKGATRTPQIKVPTETKPVTGLDNELVIDADVLTTPRPKVPVSATGNTTTASTGSLVDGKGVVELNIKASRHLHDVQKVQGAITNGVKPLPTQVHHFATNKHSIFTDQMKAVIKPYKLSLDGAWNKQAMPHLGRHPHKYHNFVLERMKRAAFEAGNSKERFLELFDLYVKQPVIKNPNLLRKAGWQ